MTRILDVSAILPEAATTEMVADVSRAALSILAEKGADIKTVRHYTDMLGEGHLYYEAWNPQAIHSWFADAA